MTHNHPGEIDAVPPASLSARPRAGLALVIGAFVLLAGLYSVVAPPFETPDEIWHYAFIQHLAAGRGLPVSTPNTQAPWRQQGVQAPGYYLAAAALTAAIDQGDFPALYARANPQAASGRPDAPANRNYLIHHADEGWPWRGSVLALHVARLFAVTLGAVTLWAIYRALELILDRRWALLGTALVGLIPQFIFISAAASNDNAINALAALVLWRLVALVVAPPEAGNRNEHPGAHPRGRDRGAAYSWRSLGPALAIGGLLGLALLTKLSALGLVALAGLAVVLAAWRARRWRLLIYNGLAVGLPALAIAGWWYARNWVLYRDPLAWNVWEANILLRVVPAGWRTIVAELGSLARSFWGLFGWLNVPYPAWVYGAFRVLTIAFALGLLLHILRWLISLVRRRRPPFDWRWAGGWLLILWPVLLAISWIRFMRIAPAAQGRYFFPAAPSLALLMLLALGGYRLLRLSERAARRTGWAVAAALLLLSAVTPFWIIQPAYRPPAAVTAAGIPAVTAEVGSQFAILGASAEPSSLLPGETARVTVVWRALAPTAGDYSVFIHLVNAEGLTIAQADTMPGGGLRPTSQWAPGETRAERYDVIIPEAAYTPDRGRWAVGLYDHATGKRLPVRLIAADPALAATADPEGLRFGAAEVAARPGKVPNRIAADFADNVTLEGYSFSSRSVRAGKPFTVTLYWRARGPVAGDYTTFAHLLDAGFGTYGGHDGVPEPRSPAWQPGRVVTDTHTFTVAPDAASGVYRVEVSLYPWPDFDRLALANAPGAEGADRLLLGPVRVTGQH
jgi:4-amino-4-deoxy-L-arabinose transferase-like glycosyltransferase